MLTYLCQALEALSVNWDAVRATLLTGHRSVSPVDDHTFSFSDSMMSDGTMQEQDCTADLDRFVHHLLCSCPPSVFDSVLNTAIKVNPTTHTMAHIIIQAMAGEPIVNLPVVSRFVRSVVRVFMILSSDSLPNEATAGTSHQRHGPMSANRVGTDGEVGRGGAAYKRDSSALTRCRKVFLSFQPLAVQVRARLVPCQVLTRDLRSLLRTLMLFLRPSDLVWCDPSAYRGKNPRRDGHHQASSSPTGIWKFCMLLSGDECYSFFRSQATHTTAPTVKMTNADEDDDEEVKLKSLGLLFNLTLFSSMKMLLLNRQRMRPISQC